MKLTRVELKDFRCFGEATFDLTKTGSGEPLEVVLLVGGNGSGKSAFIQAISGLFTGVHSIYGGELLSSPDVRRGATECRVEARWLDWSVRPPTIRSEFRAYERRRASPLADVQSEASRPPYQPLPPEEQARLRALPPDDPERVAVGEENRLRLYYENPLYTGPVGSPGWEMVQPARAASTARAVEARTSMMPARGLDDARSDGPWRDWIDTPNQVAGLIDALDIYRLVPPRRVMGPNVEQVIRHRCADALAATIRQDGSVHPRAQGLKQWIVNLDYLRAKSKADRGQELHLWEILHHALDMLLRPYRFEGVDNAFQVLFGTPSGSVPIEALSDGFRSTFTIVADLLLRLNLATRDPEQVLEQEGVCLIDEVDAHLHPRWQETIIPGLRALFPNVQFIATTHSPIVVSSVEPENVFRLEAEDP
jgi:energy-coupling factor transporter ATP-binding protein EcfA2